MPKQILNAEQVSLLATHFPLRNDSSYAWGNAISGMLLTPRLRGLWCACANNAFDNYDLSPHGRTLTTHNNPNPNMQGITPFVMFDRAATQYYSRATETDIEITDYMSMWTWIRFHTESTGNTVYYFSKFYTVGGNRAYLLYKDSLDKFRFGISGTGADWFTIDDGGVNYAIDTWFFVAGIYIPSTSITLYVGNAITGILTPYTLAVAIPAAIFNSTEALEIGRGNRTNYLDGYLSLWGLTAYPLPDVDIFTKFHQTRPLFMW